MEIVVQCLDDLDDLVFAGRLSFLHLRRGLYAAALLATVVSVAVLTINP